jgi:hypothetical protein
MSEGSFQSQARSDFGKARTRETITRILSMLKVQRDEMLSLGDVRSLLRPDSETYRGMQTIPIAKIVGSEGRYKDFNRAFLPRHDKLMRRWISVDIAHYRDVELPPIKVFEIGGAYFVRDGNHRVSVARAKGAEFIDAEVISLASQVAVTPGMSLEELKRVVIGFEKARFFEETNLDVQRPGACIEFTEVGRYDELRLHIREHKWYLNLRQASEIPLPQAAASWYDMVYLPVMAIVRESRILARFPPHTEADLYAFVSKHWGQLSRRYGPLFTLEEAAEDFVISRKEIARKAARRWAARLRSLLPFARRP